MGVLFGCYLGICLGISLVAIANIAALIGPDLYDRAVCAYWEYRRRRVFRA